MASKVIPGLTAQIKNKLIQQALERRLKNTEQEIDSVPISPNRNVEIAEQHYRFHLHPGYQQIRIMNDGAAKLGNFQSSCRLDG